MRIRILIHNKLIELKRKYTHRIAPNYLLSYPFDDFSHVIISTTTKISVPIFAFLIHFIDYTSMLMLIFCNDFLLHICTGEETAKSVGYFQCSDDNLCFDCVKNLSIE